MPRIANATSLDTIRVTLGLIFKLPSSFGWQIIAIVQQTKRAMAQTTVADYSWITAVLQSRSK